MCSRRQTARCTRASRRSMRISAALSSRTRSLVTLRSFSSSSNVLVSCVHYSFALVLIGYNCTLFAYGQTGSGKSYSIIGYPPNLCANRPASISPIEHSSEIESVPVYDSTLSSFSAAASCRSFAKSSSGASRPIQMLPK